MSSLAFAYRSSVVDSIGETPYYLVHGRNPKLPTSVIFGSKAQLRHDAQQYGLDLTQRLRDSFQAAPAVQENADDLRKKRYDQSHVKTDYAEGELVLLFVPQTQPGLVRKLQCKWRGPFRIVQKTTSLNYVIRDLDTNKTQKVHVQRLRKYVPLPSTCCLPTMTTSPALLRQMRIPNRNEQVRMQVRLEVFLRLSPAQPYSRWPLARAV